MLPPLLENLRESNVKKYGLVCLRSSGGVSEPIVEIGSQGFDFEKSNHSAHNANLVRAKNMSVSSTTFKHKPPTDWLGWPQAIIQVQRASFAMKRGSLGSSFNLAQDGGIH